LSSQTSTRGACSDDTALRRRGARDMPGASAMSPSLGGTVNRGEALAAAPDRRRPRTADGTAGAESVRRIAV